MSGLRGAAPVDRAAISRGFTQPRSGRQRVAFRCVPCSSHLNRFFDPAAAQNAIAVVESDGLARA